MPLSLNLRGVEAQEKTVAPEKLSPSAGPSAQAPEKEHDRDDLLFALKREQWFYRQRAYPSATIPKGAYWRSQQQRETLFLKRRALATARAEGKAAAADPFANVTWTADGPQPAAAYYGPAPFSGRATAIAVHPTDLNTVYLGTAAGGVWKTTDGGQTWAPLTDSQASLATGAVTIDPNNPNTVYVGTGEANSSGDSYYGQGLLKSTDAGSTWTLIRSPFTSGDTAPPFTQIAIQPGNGNIVLAATQAGLYRSADGGSTWTQVIYTGTTAVIFDVKNTSVMYAGTGGYAATLGPMLKSTDAGQTWTAIPGTGSNIIPAPAAVFRTAITETADGMTLFAAFARSDFGAPGYLYKSTDGGMNWTPLSQPSAGDGFDWYRNAVVVSPTNPSVLYASGAGLYESVDGGMTWAEGSGVYADQHAFTFSGDGSRMYLADDGGVFVTMTPNLPNASFTSLNATINSMTFYPGFSLLAGKPNTALAGSQDHGVNLYTGTLAWANGEQSGFCGDGGSVYVDPQGGFAYAHCQGGPANWVANPTGDASTTSWIAAESGISTTDRLPWVADIKGDQQTLSTVYTVTNRLYQSTNNAQSWAAISGDLTAGSNVLNSIGVSPSDSNTIYTGAGDSTISVTRNALMGPAATWTTLSGLPNRGVTKIVVAPDSAMDVYVTLGGFNAGRVFHSTNGGATWADISGDLPNTNVDSLLLDPDLVQTIYVATDTGVYATSNNGVNWMPLGQGLPNVVVQDILMDEPDRTIRVITHGRGAWDAIVPVNGLASSATSLSFGNQTKGTVSAAQPITLTNNLRSSLAIASIQVTGEFAETNNCQGSLTTGGTCTVNVTFNPTAPGTFGGTLVVSTASNNVSIALSGTGLGIPQISLGSSVLTFPSQAIGITSATQSVMVSNSGDGALSNIAVAITGANGGDFSQTNTCGATLLPGANCSITAGFNPTATGSRTATLSIADNAPSAPQVVAVTGTGVAPFMITAASPSATATAGSSATFQLTLAAAAGFPLGSSVQLSCSGAPSLSTCSLSPQSVASGSSMQAITATVTTTAATTAYFQGRPSGSFALAGVSILGLLVVPFRRRGTRWLAIVLLCLCAGMSGCGGGNKSSGSPGTPAGTYSVTVTAAQGTTYQTTQALTLAVQ